MNLKPMNLKSEITSRELAANLILKRKRTAHKGDFGRILICAGSLGMAGAAALSAGAALRTGSGLVRVLVPKELFTVLQITVPEATCIDRSLAGKGKESGLDLAKYASAAAGPGLGRGKEAEDALLMMLAEFKGPLVLDADALNIISKKNLFDIVKRRPGGLTAITPHPGEAERILERKIGFSENERRKTACELSRKTGAITLLKGAGTIIADPNGVMYKNTTGNPGMATAGSGDVLAGVITSLAGQGIPLFEAAVCGAYLHGKAGDLAARDIGEYGLVAGDICRYIAPAIKEIAGK